MLAVIAVFAALAGGAFGSFAGVVATRGLAASMGGRSHCDACARTLVWYELVPLLGYVALRGRCRTCRTRIGWGPFFWEAGGAAVAVAIAVLAFLAARGTTG